MARFTFSPGLCAVGLSAIGLVGPAILLASAPARADEPFGPVAVTVTAKTCEPNELTVPAGPVSFVITNKSTRILEWEILKGVLVIDERENIAPGFKAKLTTKLEAGTYEITCGVIGNPKGRLVVTAATGAAAKVTEADLIAPTADFRVAAVGRIGDLDDALKAFVAAAASGDAAGRTQSLARLRRAHFGLAILDGALGAAAKPFADDLAAIDVSAGPVPPATLDRMTADFDAYRKAARALVPAAASIVAQAVAASDEIATLAAKADGAAAVRIAGLADAIDMVAVRFAPLAGRADAALVGDLKRSIDVLKQADGASAGPAVGEAAKALSDEMRRLSTALGA